MHSLPPCSPIRPICHPPRRVRSIRGYPRRLMGRLPTQIWWVMMRCLIAIGDFKKEEDMMMREKNINISMVGIRSRMGRIRTVIYVVRESPEAGPRNTTPATSLRALLLQNPDPELKRGSGLGLVRAVRLLFRLPHPNHPAIARTMNHNRSHYAWQHLGYLLLPSHRHR